MTNPESFDEWIERTGKVLVGPGAKPAPEPARPLDAKPTITIRNLDQMYACVMRIGRILDSVDGVVMPFRQNIQLEALEMLRQLVGSANAVAAKIAKEADDDGIPL